MALLHGTCVALRGRGILLRGPSGAGKSDLALRLLDEGAELVADDQVSVDIEDGVLIAEPPETIAGKLEVRGLGIVDLDYAALVPLALIVDLVDDAKVERLPEPEWEVIEGVEVPVIRLDPYTASAPAKVRLALREFG
jgi:serine kinase of HPr protein (carbohydrate metabolism regulator)